MSTAGSISAVSQSLPSAVEKYPAPFDSVEEDGSPYLRDYDGFNWDQLPVLPPIQLGGGCQPRSAVDHVGLELDMTHGTVAERSGAPGDGQWWSGVPSPPPSSSPKPDAGDENILAADSLQGLTSQATAVSAQAVSATRLLLRPGSAPPTVSSAHVNEAFEGTRTLVRIINNIVAMVSPGDGGDELEAARGDGGCRAADIGGLVLTTLACHQHLLVFFRAIYDSIDRCVESVAAEKRPPGGGGGCGSSLHGDGPPCTAQFTMVLQLLMHLINRMDRCLFPARPSSPVSSSVTSTYGGASGGSSLDRDLAGQEAEDMMPDTVGIPNLAQALVRAMPDDHLRLRRTILQLQTRMERLEAF